MSAVARFESTTTALSEGKARQLRTRAEAAKSPPSRSYTAPTLEGQFLTRNVQYRDPITLIDHFSRYLLRVLTCRM
jgi:hypothetical protein